MSPIVLSDDSSSNTVNQITRTALKTSPLGQSNIQKKRKSRSISDPAQKNQPTYDLEDEKDFLSLNPSKTTPTNLPEISGVTKGNLGDREVSEKMIDKIAQPKKERPEQWRK